VVTPTLFTRALVLATAIAVLGLTVSGPAPALATCSEGQLEEAKLQFVSAENLLNQQQWAQALPQLQSIVDFCPDFFPALRGMGLAYMNTGDLDKAAAAYTRAISAIQASDAVVDAADHANLAKVYAKQKKYKEARAEYMKAERLSPNDCAVLFNLGVLHSATQFYKEAVETLESALASCPDLSDTILPQLAQASDKAAQQQRSIGNAEKAKFYQTKAEEYGGSAGGTTTYDLVKASMKEKDYPKAVQLCDQLLAKDPTHTGALLTKARALDALGQQPSSIKTYRDYLAIKPNDIAANAAMIIVMAEDKQCAEATAEAVAAAKRFSSMGTKEMGKINFAWGKALFCAGDYAGAKAKFNAAAASGDEKWAQAGRDGAEACDQHLNFQAQKQKPSGG
jgi:tetratricopeptide (TPR) repeat protein